MLQEMHREQVIRVRGGKVSLLGNSSADKPAASP